METVKINIVPKGAVKTAHASQGDAPRVVRFELFDELLPYTLDGSEDITLKVVRPDTEEIVSSVTNTEEAYIDVSFTSEMTAIRGVANCEIKISKSGAEIGSHNFDLNIERDAYGEDITVETAHGIIATFTTGVIDNLVGLKTTFEPKQDLHGYNTPWIDSNVVNKAPYLSRALAGTASRIGNYEYNKLVGGTVAFNQLVRNGNFENTNNWFSGDTNVGVISVNNNALTMTLLQAPPAIYQPFLNQTAITVLANHKYFISCEIYLPHATNVRIETGGGVGLGVPVTETNKFVKVQTFYTRNTDSINRNIAIYPQYLTNVWEVGDAWKIKNVIFIDLTAMFGSTIADYIYSLETAQAGAGVSFFKALFDKDYYAYNAGELISVKTSSHVTKDANNNVISNIALDPDLELRGIPKLDANNNLYYDGDIYESNGDVTRRYGIVDLGSINWSKITHNDVVMFGSDTIPDRKEGSNLLLCQARYLAVTGTRDALVNLNMALATYNASNSNKIAIRDDSYSDAAAFKTSLDGLYLLYEKATEASESADPFTDPQEIDAQGSEEFIDNRSVPIPVGHESYYANICEIEGIDSITFYHSGEDTQDPESVTVEIDQEVYGGYYDKDLGIVLNKKLVDLGSLEYTYYGANLRFAAKINDGKPSGTASGLDSAMSELYPISTAQYSAIPDRSISVSSNYFSDITCAVIIHDENYTSVSELKKLITGRKISYELADPIIIPADAVNFETVKGVNNVWSDTNGETEVKFYVKES